MLIGFLSWLFGAALSIPIDYVIAHDEVFAALERGDGEAACHRMDAYYESHDRLLLQALGLAP